MWIDLVIVGANVAIVVTLARLGRLLRSRLDVLEARLRALERELGLGG